MGRIHRTIKASVDVIDPGELGAIGEADRHYRRLRSVARSSTRYGNLLAPLYYAYRVGVIESEEWSQRKRELNVEFGKELSDAVRAHYYSTEMIKIGRSFNQIRSGEKSLPTFTDRFTIPLKQQGVKIEEVGGEILVRLSIFPRHGSAPKQPTFRIQLGRGRGDNERRVGRREIGELFWEKDVHSLLRQIASGEIPCTGARLIVKGRQMKLALTCAREIEERQLDANAWGLIWIDAIGQITALPKSRTGVDEEEAAFMMLDRSTWLTPPEMWQKLIADSIAFNHRLRRLKRSLKMANARSAKIDSLIDKRHKWQRHWINIFANLITEWVIKNRCEPYIVYSAAKPEWVKKSDMADSQESINLRSVGKIVKAPIQPEQLARRIGEVCEERGLPFTVIPEREAICMNCNAKIDFKEGLPQCQCQ